MLDDSRSFELDVSRSFELDANQIMLIALDFVDRDFRGMNQLKEVGEIVVVGCEEDDELGSLCIQDVVDKINDVLPTEE